VPEDGGELEAAEKTIALIKRVHSEFGASV
jgi:hypothetical protein